MLSRRKAEAVSVLLLEGTARQTTVLTKDTFSGANMSHSASLHVITMLC